MTADFRRPRRPSPPASVRPARCIVVVAAGAALLASGCADAVQLPTLPFLSDDAPGPVAATSDAAADLALQAPRRKTPAQLAQAGEGLAPGPLRGGPEADRGSALLAAGHAAAAERAFSVSLATEGTSAQAIVGLGAANRALGRQAAARDLLKRAVTLWPGDVSARNAFGAVLYDDAEYAAARAQFETALSLIAPQDAAARLEVERNLAFADAALERERVAKGADEAATPRPTGPEVRPLGGGRWRIAPRKGS
ncbi:MAG: tetratricopeptide repeat protein [Pseudomonadota bacterium]